MVELPIEQITQIIVRSSQAWSCEHCDQGNFFLFSFTPLIATPPQLVVFFSATPQISHK